MRIPLPHTRWLTTAGSAMVVALALLIAAALTTDTPARASGQSLGQLNSALGQNQATQSSLSSDLAALNGQIDTLNHQISLVQSREAAVQQTLSNDRAQLAATQVKLTAQRTRLTRARRLLARARRLLAAQLVSSYEQPQQSLVSVVLNANGFSQMLDQIQDIKSEEDAQQRAISFTTSVRDAASRAARTLGRIQHRQTVQTTAAATEARALAGMNTLLSSRQTALSDVESARATALANARAQGARLRSAINTIKAQQAAAAKAAAEQQAAAEAAAAQSSSAGSPAASGSTAAPSGGWAIPASVVMCESGGQNLPPNSAGASGYYQIMPATWAGEGGTGPAAYLASFAEQSAIAAKLWNGGAGASNWVCAGIVGIT